MLQSINDNQTRLIIRTHRPDSDNMMKSAFDYYIGEGLHFIMERATLKDFKARVEVGAGPVFSDTRDKLWFFGIATSAITIAILIFLMHGIGAIVVPALLSTSWTFILLVFDPVPLYSLLLLIIVSGLVLHNIYSRKKRSKKPFGD